MHEFTVCAKWVTAYIVTPNKDLQLWRKLTAKQEFSMVSLPILPPKQDFVKNYYFFFPLKTCTLWPLITILAICIHLQNQPFFVFLWMGMCTHHKLECPPPPANAVRNVSNTANECLDSIKTIYIHWRGFIVCYSRDSEFSKFITLCIWHFKVFANLF